MGPILRKLVAWYMWLVNLHDVIAFFWNSLLCYLGLLYRCFIPRPKRSIAGEVALVTGGGAGIGAHICLLMGRLGAIVVCVDIDRQQCDNITKRIRESGGVAFGFQCDVTDREAVEELHKKILEEIGDVTILVNNAGVRLVRPFLHYKDEQIERTINTNLYGQVWMLRTFLPRMIEINRGSIISMSALAGYGGFPMMLPFTASKFAVRGLMEGLYLELRNLHMDHEIHLMTVAPFIVDTGMVKGSIIRFPGLINVVPVEKAARIIVNAMRRRETVIFIPKIYYYIMNFLRVLPLRVQMLLTDFIDTGVEVNYDTDES